MKFLLGLIALFFFTSAYGLSAFDRRMLAAGIPYYPLISEAHSTVWPGSPRPSVTAALIEKESRWNPRAELCVPKPDCTRERGIGLGQFTITRKFNVFNEVAQLYPPLRPWTPDQYRDPRKQIIGIVAKTRMHYRQCSPLTKNEEAALACMLSSYNGGHGGYLSDRRLCGNTKGCDPSLWFGHIEVTSMKAKIALPGYGQSFFQINRGYVDTVLRKTSAKYIIHLGS